MVEVTEATPKDDAFRAKSREYKLAERAYNKAMVVNIIADENRKRKELTVVLHGLTYQETPLLTYLEEEKKNGKTEEELVNTTTQILTSLVETILDQYVYDIK